MAKTEPKPLSIPAPLVDLVLLGPVDDRRQLQDSPILGDVWMAYAEKPSSVQDLLMTPHKRSTAGVVASHVAKRLGESKITRQGSHQIAYLQGLVAVRLDLVELLKVIVPMTHWWTDRKIPAALAKYSEAALKKHLRELFESIEIIEGSRPHREFPPLELPGTRRPVAVGEEQRRQAARRAGVTDADGGRDGDRRTGPQGPQHFLQRPAQGLRTDSKLQAQAVRCADLPGIAESSRVAGDRSFGAGGERRCGAHAVQGEHLESRMAGCSIPGSIAITRRFWIPIQNPEGSHAEIAGHPPLRLHADAADQLHRIDNA
jgi:hypothetical protein